MNYRKLCGDYYKFQDLVAERYIRLYENFVNSGYEMSENKTKLYDFLKKSKSNSGLLSFEFPGALFVIKCDTGDFDDIIVNNSILRNDSEFENYLDCINDTRSVFWISL